MMPTADLPPGSIPDVDYGLSAVAQHNAINSERFPAYQEDSKGLGIYDEYANTFRDNMFHAHNPPTPHSNCPSEGIRTRSGRSTRRADSPFSATKSRVSKSPMPRPRRAKKAKLDKMKTPKLTAPLSVLTKDMSVPLKNMDEWVNRSAEMRRKEVEKRNGYVTRPMNSFMLYRSAYAERTKQWCLQNNHQVVSSVSGESWPMEPSEVREQFNEWAKIERANHAGAHPDYKFSPSKSIIKKRKNEETDEEENPTDADDPEAEYRGSRSAKPRKQKPRESTYLANTHHGYETTPYYTRQIADFDASQYPYAGTSRPLPSNISFDGQGLAYNPLTGQYVQLAVQPPAQYQAAPEVATARVPTPQSLGGYGLPGQTEEVFAAPRNSTPMQQYYQQHSQPVHSYQDQYVQQRLAAYQQQHQQLYEHQQYLQSQMQPQQIIDPSLEMALAEAAAHPHGLPNESHFDNAIGDMGGDLTSHVYFDQYTSPDATLAPTWSPTEGLS